MVERDGTSEESFTKQKGDRRFGDFAIEESIGGERERIRVYKVIWIINQNSSEEQLYLEYYHKINNV